MENSFTTCFGPKGPSPSNKFILITKRVTGLRVFVYNGMSLLQLFGLYGCWLVIGVCTNVVCIVLLWKMN